MCENHPEVEYEGDIVGTANGHPVMKMSRRTLMRGMALGSVAALVPNLSSCSTNPETGEKQFILISDAQLRQQSAAAWNEIRRKEPVMRDPRYNNRLRGIGQKVAVGAGRGNQPWEYAMFDSDAKNAFVLPGNQVGFYRGMMDFVDNDSQVGAILGHEVGHVTGRHAAARASAQMAAQGVALAGAIGGSVGFQQRCKEMERAYAPGGYSREEIAQINQCRQGAARNAQLLNAALGVGLTYGVILPYSRRHELQADTLGAVYMTRAGYNPMQAVRLWEKMAAANTNRTPSFLSTHPDPSYRAKNLNDFIKAKGLV